MNIISERNAGLHPLENDTPDAKFIKKNGTQVWYDARLDDDVETMRNGREQRAKVFIEINGIKRQDMTNEPLDYKIVGKTHWLDKLNNLDVKLQSKALMPFASAMRTAKPSDSIIRSEERRVGKEGRSR